ncbi:PAS domain S-box protein, partial [candidate division WOR-3 bacterium]|nr:PAS domain S-box protein [candidate division WOR-3 bacterium]
QRVKERTEELHTSEAQYQAIYDRSLLCVYVHDFEGRFLDANNAVLNLLGYTRAEFVDLNIISLLNDEQRNTVYRIIQELQQSGKQKSLNQLRLRKKNGGFVWVETEAVLLHRNGEPYAIQGIARDISMRKELEEQWKRSEADKAMILESIMEHVIYHDLHHKIIWANDAAARSLSMMSSQLVGKHCYRLWQQRSTPCPGCPVQEAMRTGKAQIAEMTTSDGRIWLIRGYPVRDDEDTIIGGVEVTFDITVIRQADEALRESEEKYKALTENLNVGIYRNTTGSKGQFIEANPAIVRMFGYASKQEFLEMNVADLYQNPRDREEFNKKMLKFGFVREEELHLKKKDGSPFFGSVSAVAVKDEHGDVLYYDGIVYDITERKKAEDQLQESYLKLKHVLNGTVNALASTTEKRDPYTAGHQHRVAQLACAIAREMGLSEEEIEGIRVAAIVHDIGKIYVAAEILNKPVKLKDIEMALVKAHCQAGYEILKTVDFPWPVARMVLQHHEKLDGSGYPNGLKDDEIILGAKILAVADVVEAMMSHRPYRSALSIEEALNEVKTNRGTLYAPTVVDACERVLAEGFAFK